MTGAERRPPVSGPFLEDGESIATRRLTGSGRYGLALENPPLLTCPTLVTVRGFREEDAAGDGPVALVSERAARQLWPGQDPIGRRIVNADTGGEPFNVIGVVRDAHMGQTPFDRPPFVLYPFGQRLAGPATLHVHTDAGFSPVRCTCRIDGRSRRAHCSWFSRGGRRVRHQHHDRAGVVEPHAAWPHREPGASSRLVVAPGTRSSPMSPPNRARPGNGRGPSPGRLPAEPPAMEAKGATVRGRRTPAACHHTRRCGRGRPRARPGRRTSGS